MSMIVNPATYSSHTLPAITTQPSSKTGRPNFVSFIFYLEHDQYSSIDTTVRSREKLFYNTFNYHFFFLTDDRRLSGDN